MSCTMPTALFDPFREAWPSSEYQIDRCFGLQRYAGVDTSPRHRQCSTPGIHGAEGRHKIWGEAQLGGRDGAIAYSGMGLW